MKTRVLVAGALFGVAALSRVLLPVPTSLWISTGICIMAVGTFAGRPTKPDERICRLGGLMWDRQAFCRGWFITGATGSGKTLSGIRPLLFQVFKNQPHFGGLCIDDKGTIHETLVEMATHFGRADDVILLRVRPDDTAKDWSPTHRFNLTGDRSIPFGTYARCVVDTASALGNRREQGFFRSAAQIHIGQALAALAVLGYDVTLDNVSELLTDAEELREVIDELESCKAATELSTHFKKYASQPPDQLAGITGTVGNYLHYFGTPEIAEVFCRDSTFDLGAIDQGKIICLALPQKFQIERRYVGTMLKQLFFMHALRRFDRSEAERRQRNLLLFIADEAQHFLTVSEDGLSDHSVVDVVREAGVAFVAATQSSTSLVPVLGLDNAKVLTLNLRNRMIFTAADEDDARASAEFLGKKISFDSSETTGDGRRSRTRHRKETFHFEPHKLRRLRNHECILVHAEKGFRRCMISPIEPTGKVCHWHRWWKFW